MKYLIGLAITMVVALVSTLREAPLDDELPGWALALVGPLIITFPPSMLCRLLTRKIPGILARIVDLVILFCLVGACWAIFYDFKAAGILEGQFRFWLGVTVGFWSEWYVPFVLSVGVIEWWTSRRDERPK